MILSIIAILMGVAVGQLRSFILDFLILYSRDKIWLKKPPGKEALLLLWERS